MISPALHKSGRTYVWAVILIGFAVLVWSLDELATKGVGQQWFVLAALTLISGSATVKLPSVPASISISETFVVAAVLLYGPAAGTVIVALDGLIISYWIAKRRREIYRALFNMSAPAVSAWIAAHLFFLISGVEPLVVAPASLDRILPALVVFAATYFGLNSWLIAFAVSLEERVSPLLVWREHFAWLSLNYFCGASMAVLLVVYTREIDLRFIGVIVPLLLVLYFTFKTSMDRVEDANRHVEKVNRLYLSTIETLAMAIDAKDQVTHGHIRRVQRYAVGLAKELGIGDEALLKAVEAAALLHDMGKLAVPEHILNKPGKLTDAEFERMKAHASVGAEILSAIDFPYPVVPIVRHHHESWDGSGYPDGLRGTDIPIGARILSVVDCFDALTSDRPYRRRLSDSEAIEILRERRGCMYDPLVVDTFERVHKKLEAAQAVPPLQSKEDVDVGLRSAHHATVYPAPRAAVLPMGCVEPTVKHVVDQLAASAPAKLVVFYGYDREEDLLIALATSEGGSSVLRSRIAVGEQLSGWVAANRRAIINSDAALDLGDRVALFSPPLAFTLSLPILRGDDLAGVVTMYSDLPFSSRAQGSCTEVLADFSRLQEEDARPGSPSAIHYRLAAQN